MVEKKIISELPSSTVKLITATQIATSVCNIVKELVENAMDAGSTVIRVKLENSGLSKIEVIDNGSGVSKENVYRMALPHYTSKICQHQDLESLATYGFRGEALAAICAVAKLSVTTKTAEDPTATTYIMDNNGIVINEKPSHLSQGTLVAMTSLFWNIPVRKQYYQTPKRKKEEMMKVENLLLNYGLIHPELHLSFHHDHNLIWQKNRAIDFKANVRQTLGHEICSHMEFLSEDDLIQVFLMAPKRSAPLDICFQNRPDHSFVFINNRPVVSKEIEKLMKELYALNRDGNQKSTLYPIFIVSLHFPGDEIDVNVEPNKSKVLMKRQGDVLEWIRNRVENFLGPSVIENPPKISSLSQTFNDSSSEAVNSNEVPEVSVVEETIMEDQTTSHFQAPPLTQFGIIENSQLGINQLESTRVDPSVYDFPEDDCLFHGFNEPFQIVVDEANVEKSTYCNQSEIVAIGSDQWSRGLGRDSEGRTVHAIQVLRGQPHLDKRLPDSRITGNVAKKPKLIETMETSRIVGSPPTLLETVNGSVRKVPADPFGEYCKDMRNELLSQDPLMSFTELSQHLSHGWKNLDKSNREKYERKAETNKQRYNANKIKTTKLSTMSNTSLDRFLLGQTPVARVGTTPTRHVVETAPPAKRTSISVGFSLNILSRSLKSFQQIPKRQWFCMGKLENCGWLCSNGHMVMAVNFTRLYEMILYSRLTREHIVPSKPLVNPILIDKRIFGDLEGWRKLWSLPNGWESATTRTITDVRLVANGVGIRLGTESEDANLMVYQVPSNLKRFELNDVKSLLRQVVKNGSTVESCRPEQTLVNLKFEAARLAAERCTEPDEGEVSELLEQWLSKESENVCLHGEPIIWNYPLNAQPV